MGLVLASHIQRSPIMTATDTIIENFCPQWAYSPSPSFYIKAKLQLRVLVQGGKRSWNTNHKCLRGRSCSEPLSLFGIPEEERATPFPVIFNTRMCIHFFTSSFSKSLPNLLFLHRLKVHEGTESWRFRSQRTLRFPQVLGLVFPFPGLVGGTQGKWTFYLIKLVLLRTNNLSSSSRKGSGPENVQAMAFSIIK